MTLVWCKCRARALLVVRVNVNGGARAYWRVTSYSGVSAWVLQVEVKSLSYFGAKVRVGTTAANVDMVREHMNRGVKLEKTKKKHFKQLKTE